MDDKRSRASSRRSNRTNQSRLSKATAQGYDLSQREEEFFMRKIQNERYEEIDSQQRLGKEKLTLVKFQGSGKVLQKKVVSFLKKQKADDEVQFIERIKELNNPYLRLPKYYEVTQSLADQKFNLVMFSEQQVATFQDELTARIERREHFTKKELLPFLKCAFNVLKFNEIKQIRHGRLTAACFVKQTNQLYYLEGYQPHQFDEINKQFLQAPEDGSRLTADRFEGRTGYKRVSAVSRESKGASE